ncbi:MAG TPA: N-6 DNA methylase [Solirubrobacteraceae bacterium]|nr:N-6 DNA methylase [Solirubrobacteraceae bacterium]
MVEELKQLGWDGRLQWKPEWPVPDTPHDLTKRERGQKFKKCGSCDLVAFDDESYEWHALRIIFEFKARDIDAGRGQLYRYLSSEPLAKMGFWTNGSESLAIYKKADGNWTEVPGAPLPRPGEDLTRPSDAPLTWETMEVPGEAQLAGAFKRLLATVVVADTRATRREDQLREMVHVMLAKLDSDAQAAMDPSAPVAFTVQADEDANRRIKKTADHVQSLFKDLYDRRKSDLFSQDDRSEIALNEETIYEAVVEMARFKLLLVDSELVAKAFQIFRTRALKSGEGQFLTPQRVIRPCVLAMDIQPGDKIIDPACGTGGFLMEAVRQMGHTLVANNPTRPDLAGQLLTKWANERVFGVDWDAIGVKLTRMMMLAVGDGSTHTLLGDSIRGHRWKEHYPHLLGALADEQFTVVMTNPPFGEALKVKAADLQASNFTISCVAAMLGSNNYVDLEIGLVFLERAWRLLRIGGRVGIILPETYFFSHRYRWLPDWLDERLELRGMLNVPMEAFQEFCRAKTNFYIFEKVGRGPASSDNSLGRTKS